MTDPVAARSFLLSEVAALEPFGFVAVVPLGHPAHVIEVTRQEAGGLQVRVPGRPPSVPELTVVVRGGLEKRGFTTKDPADSKNPWIRDVSDSDEAVTLLQELLVEVFGEKRDATLDVGHGSHKTEYETQQKLDLARTRVSSIVADVLGRAADLDDDGDFVLPVDDVHVIVAPRATPDGQVLVRVFTITNVAVAVLPELGLFLARLNFGLMFGRFALDVEHNSIWFDETLLGEQFREEELRFAINVVSTTADHWDDRIKQMFGGATHQEVLAGQSAEPAPSTKPGEGVGLYL